MGGGGEEKESLLSEQNTFHITLRKRINSQGIMEGGDITDIICRYKEKAPLTMRKVKSCTKKGTRRRTHTINQYSKSSRPQEMLFCCHMNIHVI